MAHEDVGKRNWDDDDRFYASSHSDDSPILSYRSDKRRYVPYTTPSPPEERERRSTFSVLAKFCLFSAAMILFCVLMYIPVYNKAKYYVPKGILAEWSIHTNRDTKIYVQPNNVTTIHEPKNICNNPKEIKKKLLLLIIVCSSIENFERRKAIRETWGVYENYQKGLKALVDIRNRYKNYTYNYDLYPLETEKRVINVTDNFNDTDSSSIIPRIRRDISFNQLLPALAKALSNISITSPKTEVVPEKRFEDETDDGVILPEFDMNKFNEDFNVDYDYQSNIMRIPPKGDEENEETPDFSEVLTLLSQTKSFDKIKETISETDNTEREFQLVFLLGLPKKKDKIVQKQIKEEIEQYGDIIQESFIDSYNNLTLKSIMMLKWVTSKCDDSVRYILKTDDDTYINVPNLMLNLKNRSREFDEKTSKGEISGPEYLLIGDLFTNAKPVLDSRSKWYSPKYMYGGRVYPKYLSGMGYVMSLPAAHALYRAALRTNYFHLEDIFITGLCALRASPRISPRDDPTFAYVHSRGHCWAHAHATSHRVTAADMRAFQPLLLDHRELDRCERLRLTQVRHEQLRRKYKFKKHYKTPEPNAKPNT